MKNLFRILIILLFISCQDTAQQAQATAEKAKPALDESIKALTTTAAKKAWLEDIFKTDQGHRDKQSDAKLQNQKDTENLKKVEQYLAIHGYPDIKELGETAAVTPWIVIHHSGTLETRLRNFKIIDQAYRDGNIKGSAFYLYLFRTYFIKTGEQFKMKKSPFTTEEEIEALIEALEVGGLVE